MNEGNSEILGADEGTYADLRNDISNGGILTKSFYRYVNGNGNTIEIKSTMTIEGNGAIIDMSGINMPTFRVSAANVIFKDLTIQNAKYVINPGHGAECAAAICVHSLDPCILINCNFVNNQANYGGAVHFDGEGIMINCTFTGNSAIEIGGAVNAQHGTAINCFFSNNECWQKLFNFEHF